jgi:hypothetical protein
VNPRKHPPKGPLDPLSESEIRDGLNASGYPLEIRLLKAFSDGGMDPIIGFRVNDGEGSSREIDILANFTHAFGIGDGKVVNLQLRLLVEAKSLEPGAAFVGFPWQRPSDHNLRVNRMHFGGMPSNRAVPELDRDGDVILGPGGLSDAFDAMNAAPVCVQWAVARRTKAGSEQRTVASHDASFWEGIDGVVRSSHDMMVDHSMCRWPAEAHLMLFEMPVLVVATPTLWLYDAVAPQKAPLASTPSLILARTFELPDRTEHRLVDVVTEVGVPSFIEACRKTFEDLKARVSTHAEALVQIAKKQRGDLDMVMLNRSARARRYD